MALIQQAAELLGEREDDCLSQNFSFQAGITATGQREKNRGAVCGVANQSAVFFEWTNQRAVFGSRDRLGREGIFVGLVPSLGLSLRTVSVTGNDVSGNDVSGNDDRPREQENI